MSPQAPTYTGVTPPAVPVGGMLNTHLLSHRLIIATETLCISLATLFVAARIYTKWAILRRRDYDDYACICAWAGLIVFAAQCISASRLGLGMHIWEVPSSSSTELAKLGYHMFIYNPIIFLSKLNILLLFTQIFSVRHRFVLGVKVLTTLLLIYYTTITFLMAFACTPIRKFWRPAERGRCIDKDAMFITNSVVGMMTDVIILVSPVPLIWGLQMNPKKRIGACAVLAAGGLACFASIYRLYHTVINLRDDDKTYNRLYVLIADSWEIAFTIICGCLPCLPAAFRRFFSKSASDTRVAAPGRASDAELITGVNVNTSSLSLTPSDGNAGNGNAGRKDGLARIGESLPLEVPINEAALHQIAPRRTQG